MAAETEEVIERVSAGAPHVVIIGGGFAGLNAAKALHEAPVRITLLDRRNHHLFAPLLYQVATATLSPADIASPIRGILRRQKDIIVLLAEAAAIDLQRRHVRLTDGSSLAYDVLVIAAGASHSYFGHDEWAALAPGLKSLEDALTIRRRVLAAFEAAERESDAAKRAAWLTFIIVGGGPTGVELAGAIGELSRFTLARDFDHIDPTQATILLLEGQGRILPMFAEPLAKRATRDLGRFGVTVRTDALVTAIDEAGVLVGGDRISARTVLWAAGVQAEPVIRSLAPVVDLDRAGRVLIAPDLTIPGHPEVFVLGDAAAGKDGQGRPLPGIAPVAIQQGRWAAHNIIRQLDGQPAEPFRYKDRGSMATIGRNRAVAEIGRFRLTGFIAWLAWAVVHIFNLIGYRNRILVSLQWIIAYVTFQRGARLITEEERGESRGEREGR